jgi:hypothetical protein
MDDRTRMTTISFSGMSRRRMSMPPMAMVLPYRWPLGRVGYDGDGLPYLWTNVNFGWLVNRANKLYNQYFIFKFIVCATCLLADEWINHSAFELQVVCSILQDSYTKAYLLCSSSLNFLIHLRGMDLVLPCHWTRRRSARTWLGEAE